MKNNNYKKENKRNDNFIIGNDNDNYSYHSLNHSFQNLKNNNLKLKYAFIDNIKASNFKKSILLKINQIQNNQLKTNLKLTNLITILFSKFIGSQNYKLIHNHFSIIQSKKIQNILKIKKENISEKKIKTDNSKENYTERITNNNTIKKKIENISLVTESEVKRYNLSNHKMKSKENIFKLSNSEKIGNNSNNKKFKTESNEEFNASSNNNLFRMNNSNNYHGSLNKNGSSNNISNSKNDSKKMFSISNTRKPIIFNDISSNLNNQQNPNSLDNRKPRNNYINNNSQINKNYKKINNNNININTNSNTNHSNSIDLKVKINDKFNENGDNNKYSINGKNQNYSHSNYNNTFNNNNSNNKEKELNLSKSNISESKTNKGPVKIKLNPIEKPVLLMNFNESMDQKKASKNNNNFINVHNSNIIKNERKEIRYNLINDNKRLSLNIDNAKNDLNFTNENGDSIRGKRKFSEARSEAESNYSNLSDAKPAQGYSRKIRGFNFRNNIKYNKNPNSNNTSEEDFNKVKGGSVRYNNNNDSLFSQINSIENENIQ